MEELQTYYQIPSIAHFCNLFRHYIDLPDFDYEDLEFAFLSFLSSNDLPLDSIETNIVFKLICALLKGYFNTNINISNWETYLEKLFKIQWVDIEKKRSPFVKFDDNGEEVALKFSDLPLRTKVDIIHCLCDYRLYSDDISQLVNDISGDEYRVEPLGTDSKGYNYWYFYGTRLYRENPTFAQEIESVSQNYDEFVAKRAEEIRLEKHRTEVELKKQTLLEEKRKKEAEKRNRSLPPKVLGFRTGLRQRKSDQSLPNGIHSPKTVTKSASSVESNNKKCENKTIKELKEVSYSISERQEAWSLFCKTEEDWKELCLKFSKSKTKCEIEFHKLLSTFVPKISEIFENQEKERQKVERQKLLELLPRRLSSRIELKKIQKERDDLEEQEISRQKQELNERKSHETERQRSERIKHDRQQRAEKRLQLVEERAERALKRQAMEYEMFADSQQTDQNMETNESNESQFQYIHEEFIDIPVVPTNPKHLLYDGLEKVICNVKSNRDAWPFLEPVDGTKFPMYYQVIEEPIDLSAIEKRIEDREYETFEEVENDFKLMVNNCETFNGPKNGYTLMAYGVWRAFKKASLKHLERELSYDESNAFIYPQKWTKNNTKPAIEAKKKKIRNKKSSTFTALNVLAEAAEKAVEANESRLIKTTADTACVDTTSHSNSHLCDTNSKSAVTGGDTESKSLQIHGDMWANFLFNKNHTIDRSVTSEESDTSATNASTHENLTFKSLDEWSKSIKQSGNCVVLPQNAVIIASPPKFTHCTNGPTLIKPQISLKVISTGNNTASNTTTNTVFVNSGHSFTSSVISNNENSRKELVNADPKRLVIKLSRCESSGQVWKPVTIVTTNSAQNNLNANNITETNPMNGQTLVGTTVQQFQGLRNIPTNCIPVKKRFLIQGINHNSIAEQQNPTLTHSANASVANNLKQMPHTFQITGVQTNQNNNLKVFRLKTLDQSSNELSANQSPIVSKEVVTPFDKPTTNGTVCHDFEDNNNSQNFTNS